MRAAVLAALALLPLGGALRAQQSPPDTSARTPAMAIRSTRPATLDLGFGWRHRTGEPIRIIDVRPDSPASRAGLRDGDALIAVDGRDPTEPGGFFPHNAPGRHYRLVIQRGDQELELEFITGPPRPRPTP